MTKQALILFTKNRVYGKVKTRLAATVGHEKAMAIYQQLVQYTNEIIKPLPCDNIVFYSDQTEQNDIWTNIAQKQVQQGFDLGERMVNAFCFSFKNNYKKAIIIGTDCPELTSIIIQNAFDELNNNDVVIGPAADGGYYLLGMKEMHYPLFKNIAWSTSNVLSQTLQRCNENNLRYMLLATLHDVDNEADLQYIQPMNLL